MATQYFPSYPSGIGSGRSILTTASWRASNKPLHGFLNLHQVQKRTSPTPTTSRRTSDQLDGGSCVSSLNDHPSLPTKTPHVRRTKVFLGQPSSTSKQAGQAKEGEDHNVRPDPGRNFDARASLLLIEWRLAMLRKWNEKSLADLIKRSKILDLILAAKGHVGSTHLLTRPRRRGGGSSERISTSPTNLSSSPRKEWEIKTENLRNEVLLWIKSLTLVGVRAAVWTLSNLLRRLNLLDLVSIRERRGWTRVDPPPHSWISEAHLHQVPPTANPSTLSRFWHRVVSARTGSDSPIQLRSILKGPSLLVERGMRWNPDQRRVRFEGDSALRCCEVVP
ncbi:hypothetical protein IE53DRAFT_365932 [Violaceomyces palustris]|uniref:Uncharacterized protein n=1 Tax=Violaceomyces palustris TaxID=1673888 RepID=A0ACD0P776_9BASI|nr:hypothetical protein IE53DRAFT_365932 [Violaceomyces palustris]